MEDEEAISLIGPKISQQIAELTGKDRKIYKVVLLVSRVNPVTRVIDEINCVSNLADKEIMKAIFDRWYDGNKEFKLIPKVN